MDNYGLAAWAQAAVDDNWRYWYGTCGYKCTMELYKAKREQYPAHYGAARASVYLADIARGSTCCDCVGLIKSYCWHGVERGRYSLHPDVSADGLYELAKQRGGIAALPEQPGVLVRYKGHVGVYLGDGWVAEARGFAYGVVRTRLKDRGWTHLYRDPFIQYLDAPPADGQADGAAALSGGEENGQSNAEARDGSGSEPGVETAPGGVDDTAGSAENSSAGAENTFASAAADDSPNAAARAAHTGCAQLSACRLIRRGCHCAAVAALQGWLGFKGYSCGPVDGEFGAQTESAVRRFQRESQLAADGIIGPLTLGAIYAAR